MRRSLAWLVPFLLSTAPVLAQEHMSILEQKHWWVGAVCVGANQCAFCNAADAAQDGTTLRVQPPADVSLSLPEGVSASSATLAIGGERLAFSRGDDGDFAAKVGDGARIIQAMRRQASLTLQLDGRSYDYSLESFPKAYAAMLKACASAASP
ncbi:MAG TPA: hypothetical protein VKB42_18775 [Dongiaceae bacterium]|nr:hypothetical protein [Dongiaceae bacterium]